MPYIFTENYHALVAKLHVAVQSSGQLQVWLERAEVRRAQSCLTPSLPKPLGRKRGEDPCVLCGMACF